MPPTSGRRAAPVRVRMGLHTGEPAVGSEGYLGIDVVRAARLCTVGRGGQVLLSETTRALVGGALPDGVAVHGLGERHLKDIDEPERVFELDIANAPTPAAPEAVRCRQPASAPVPASAAPSPEADAARTLKEQFKRDLVSNAKSKNKGKKDKGDDDFGSRLSRRIEAYVQRRIEEPLERMLSEVDIIVERTAQDPEVISEKLEKD